MFNFRFISLIFAAVSMLASLSVEADDKSKADDATAVLASLIANLNSFQSDFEQRVHSENGKEIDFSAGTFSIRRPNLFRWEIKQNFAQVIVADGKNLWTYDTDLEQVTIQNQVTLLADSPLLFLTSTAEELARAFRVTDLSTKAIPGNHLFLLKPVKKESVFDSIHILFENGLMTELLMADTLGQKTTVKFTTAKLNLKLADNLFSFTVPDGVDVVDSRANHQPEE
jgi:outer membrane lipoprotein carrier protein